MHTLARICVQRPVFATVLSLTLLVVGLAGYLKLGVDRWPNVDIPVVVVSTAYPGASPKEIETAVTDRIERQVNTIGGIDKLLSNSVDGLSLVTIEFDLNKNIDVAAEEVRSKVALAKADLPPDCKEPVVMKFDVSSMPVIMYAIASPWALRDTYEYVDKKMRRQIESISGVGQVNIIGGRQRQVNIVLDPYALRSYGVTAKDVSDTLGKQNVQIPGGLIEQGQTQLTLRTQGRLQRVKQFEQIAVKSGGLRPVLLRDVARVEDSESRATSVASLNGREAVVIEVVKQSGTNAVTVIDQVKKRMVEVQKTLPAALKVTPVSDQSVYIRASLGAVQEHLLLGSVLAAVVVFLFLGNFRSTIISALAIPLSLVATYACMNLMGFTQNMITLLALTLSVGIVIDDAIVVLENIYRVLEEQHLTPVEAAIRATREIGLAVLAITLSLVAVFLPVAFMGGVVGRFLNSFGITMAAAIAVSMFVSFSLTPMLCSRWLKATPTGDAGHHEAATRSGWYGVVDHGYTVLLQWAMRHRPTVWLLCGALIVSSLPLLQVAGKNFIPDDDESQFGIQVRMPEGVSLEGCRALLERIAADAGQLPEVAMVLVRVGSDQQQTSNLGTVFVKMKEIEERADRKVTQQTNMARARREILPRYTGHGRRLSVRKQDAFGGGQAEIQIAVSGPDLAKLSEFSAAALERCQAIPGVADAESSLIGGKPELQATVDRVRAADLGVEVQDVAQALRLAVSGDDKLSDYEENGEQYEVHMRLSSTYRRDEGGLRLLDVPSSVSATKAVQLEQVVRFERQLGLASVDRYGRQRQFTLGVNLATGADQGSVTAAIDQMLLDLNMGPGYHTNYLGGSSEFAKTFTNFGIAFVLSGIFMFLVIAAQFESFKQALVVLLCLPLTVPFALLSIILVRDSLNIMSLLGMLVLLGVVKKNSILQVDRANQLRQDGQSLQDAAVQAARDRLRPILMTTIAFVAGMLPLVLSNGTGAATNRSTGSVIVGGQVFSLLLTLVATPVFYVSAESLHDSWPARVARAAWDRLSAWLPSRPRGVG